MKKLKPWLVILLVFMAGFVGGGVVTRGVVRHAVQAAIANPERVRDLIERRVTVRLRLDAAQRAEVHEILARTQSDLRTMRQEMAPRFRGIVSNAEQEIAIVLTPPQREKFEKLKEENRRLWQPH